jgi:hypothetical protein
LLDNCLEKAVAERIRRIENMAECWKVLNMFYDKPLLFVEGLMAEISAFKEIDDSEHERLYKYYYGLIRPNIDKAEKEDVCYTLLESHRIKILKKKLLPRMLELWRDVEGHKRKPPDHGAFKEFIALREMWAVF